MGTIYILENKINGKKYVGQTKESKLKMSLSKKGKPLTEEHRNNISKAMKRKSNEVV